MAITINNINVPDEGKQYIILIKTKNNETKATLISETPNTPRDLGSVNGGN